MSSSSIIQNLVSMSLKGENKWREILLKLLKESLFPTRIYSTFFILSPNSASKFKDMNKQARILSGALQIILAQDHTNVQKHKATKNLCRSMKKAHRRYEVSELEFHFMSQAILISAMFFLDKMDKATDFPDFRRGFEARMNSIKHLVVSKHIKLSTSSTSASR